VTTIFEEIFDNDEAFQLFTHEQALTGWMACVDSSRPSSVLVTTDARTL
jgi:hypothetical protein